MITNLNLGYCGRLGNQMYQFSILYILSKLHGYEIKLPIENTFYFKTVNFFQEKNELFNVFDLNKNYLTEIENIKVDHHVGKWGVTYYEDVYNINDNSDIQGDFQSSKYYMGRRNDLRNLFVFKQSIKEKCNSFLNTLNIKKQNVGVHVRKTDFVKLNNDLSMEYYTKIFNNHFELSNCNFICVSDDIGWCKQNFPNFVHFSDNDAGVDMCILTQCEHVISSNSTFSWWGAFLNNKGGGVFMPKKWFSDTYKNYYNNTFDDNSLKWEGVIEI